MSLTDYDAGLVITNINTAAFIHCALNTDYNFSRNQIKTILDGIGNFSALSTGEKIIAARWILSTKAEALTVITQSEYDKYLKLNQKNALADDSFTIKDGDFTASGTFISNTINATTIMPLSDVGDILVQGASGLSKLPSGTLNQILRSNPAAQDNLEWVDFSSLISNAIQIFDGYYNSTVNLATLGGFTDLPIDTIKKQDSIYQHTSPNADITITSSGIYIVFAKFTAEMTAGTQDGLQGKIQLDTGSGFNDISGTVCSSYISINVTPTASCSTFTYVNVTSGDRIKAQMGLLGTTTCNSTASQCGLLLFKIEGIQGPVGPAGTPGNINWQNTWVSQNYVVNDTVEYQGSAYICKLNTVSNEIPTDQTYWDLLVSKGDTGPGATVIVREEGNSLGYFSELNYVGPAITATDAGSGVANITIDISSLLTNTVQAFHAYYTGTDALNATFTDLPFDTEVVKDSIYLHTSPNATITLNETGIYLIWAKFDADGEPGGLVESPRDPFECKLRVDTGGGFNDISGTLTRSYLRKNTTDLRGTSCTTFTYYSATAGDIIKAQIRNGDQAQGNLVANGCSIMIVQLKGIEGPQGAPGPDGDMSWKGAWVSQNYVLNDVVRYLGNSYVCILNTTSSQVPTDNTYWDLVVSKGDPGAGSTVNVSEEGSNIGSFSSFNFIGSSLTATDGGSVANITSVIGTKLVPKIIKLRGVTIADLNIPETSGGALLDWTITDFTDPTIYTLIGGNTQVKINVSGVYRLHFNISYTTTLTSANVIGRIRINNVYTPGYGSTNYVSNLNDNNTGITHFTTVINLSINDIVDVKTIEEANTGASCTPISTDCIFMIEKLDLVL